jgi:hypothetical protein
MKKLMFLAALAAAVSIQAAKPFEGTVQFQTYGTDGKKGPLMEMAMRGGKTRVESEQGGRQAIAIMDPAAKSMVLLMPEQKQYMVQSLDAPKAKAGKEPKGSLKKTGRSETIAGYKAEEWAFESEGRKTLIWGSMELGAFMGDWKGPKGGQGGIEMPAELRDKGFFPLRIVADKGKKQGGMEAVSVKPGKLAAGLFEVPKGYSQMKGPGAGAAGGMPPEARQKMLEAMKDMSPEQRKMMEKMLKGQGD